VLTPGHAGFDVPACVQSVCRRVFHRLRCLLARAWFPIEIRPNVRAFYAAGNGAPPPNPALILFVPIFSSSRSALLAGPWIRFSRLAEYAGAPYQEVAAKARAHLEGLADLYVTPAREAELIVIFKEATRLEADFWEMGWRA
jgi:hypothetical protein